MEIGHHTDIGQLGQYGHMTDEKGNNAGRGILGLVCIGIGCIMIKSLVIIFVFSRKFEDFS